MFFAPLLHLVKSDMDPLPTTVGRRLERRPLHEDIHLFESRVAVEMDIQTVSDDVEMGESGMH